MPASRLAAALAGRYVIEAEAGQGGMSIVYRALDLRHDRSVAIKVLREEVSAAVGKERFLREIRIAAKLQHPNILPLFDSGEADELLFYVMPFVDDPTLREKLEQDWQLPGDEAVHITREVAAALTYAHSFGIVHRDIKPDNILITSDRAIVTDFGIATALSEAGGDRLTATGIVVGTPRYMSPEQAGGDAKLDGRSDVYSLGCVLYEMLAGEPPFSGRTPQAILARHLTQEPPDIKIVRTGLDPSLSAALVKALAKSPADRYSSAAEFAERLTTETARARRGPARSVVVRRWLTAAAVLVIVALGLVIGGGRLREAALTASLDANRIVVYPLAERGLSAEQAGAGFDAASLILVALDHTEPLKWIDGARALGVPVDSMNQAPSSRAATDAARRAGARYYLDGQLRGGADSVTAVLHLWDVAGDSTVTHQSASVDSRSGSIDGAVLDATLKVLPFLAGMDRVADAATFANRNPRAVALFLQGEGYYRSMNFELALERYLEALEEDSLLVFAAIKGAQAASWTGASEEASMLAELAVSRANLLPEKHALLARGLSAYFSGQADSAVARFNQALVADPDWTEAWVLLGETYRHTIPSDPRPDSLSLLALQTAFETDSLLGPSLIHLIEFAIRDGDVVRAEDLVARLTAINPRHRSIPRLEVMLVCLRDGPERVEWSVVDSSSAATAVYAAKELAVAGRQTECAEAALTRVLESEIAGPTNHWNAMRLLQGILVMRRDDRSAIALLDSAVEAGETMGLMLYPIDLYAGADMEAEAAEVDSFVIGIFGETYDGLAATTQEQWLMGLWNAHIGRLDKASLLMDRLRRIAAGDLADADSVPADTRRRARTLADALAAHISLAQGDTGRAIEQFAALRSNPPLGELAWDFVEALAVERMTLARLLSARGDNWGVLRVASTFDHPAPAVFLPFVAESLVLRIEATRNLGLRTLAEDFSSRLAVLRREAADPQQSTLP